MSAIVLPPDVEALVVRTVERILACEKAALQDDGPLDLKLMIFAEAHLRVSVVYGTRARAMLDAEKAAT